MLEILLILAGIIIVIVFILYWKEKQLIGKYHELIGEKEKIDRLSKQVQLDYYKRRLTEETLRNVLGDYHQKSLEIDQKIEEIEKKHGISNKNIGLNRHVEKSAPNEPSLGKKLEEIK
jgi:hypothetical protein